MKICILTTSYPTWNEGNNEFIRGKFVHDMAKYLVRAGCDVYVVTQHDKNTPCHEIKDGVSIHRFHYFFHNHETLTKDPGIPENIKKIRNQLLVPFYVSSFIWNALWVVNKYNVSVINAHWGFPTGYIGLILKKMTKRILLTTLYGAEVFPFIKGKYGLLRPLLINALNGADMLVGISQETVNAAKIISRKSEIHCIPDGIDMNYYVPGVKNNAVLAKYNCEGKRVVFFTGRMVERKGHKFLLEAMSIVKKSNLNIKLLLGGNGPLFQYLSDLRSELQVEDVTVMPGFLPEEDLVPILQSIDIYVLPSCIDAKGDTEGSATAAFEAMACGTPSIVSRVGGNTNAIQEGKGAYYFETGDATDLANKIMMLMTDDALLNHNKNESRKFIAANYSWEKSVGRYLELIHDYNSN